MTGSQDDERAPLITGHSTSTPPDENDNIHKQHDHYNLQGRALYLAMLFPHLGLLLVATDVTLVSTVSATIAADFNSLTLISWLGTAYLVALAAAQPISGKMTDIFGRRRGLLVALIVFCLGKLVCGLAPNSAVIIVGRVLSGVGGGTVSSITAYLINDLIRLNQRGLWQALGNSIWAVGIGVGGVVGGLINDWVGWRWAFLGLAPFTVIIAAGVYFGLPASEDEDTADLGGKVDSLGIFTLIAMLSFLILGLNLVEGGHVGLASIVFLVLSFVALISLVVVETKIATHPIVPIHLLADRSVAGACSVGFFLNAAMHNLLFYIPIYIQAKGFTTSEVGLQFLGEPLGASTISFMAGFALKALGGYGLVSPVASLLFLVAPLGFFLSDFQTPVWVTVCLLVVMGGSFGSVLTVIGTSIVAVTDPEVQAPVTGMLYAFRQVGASTGLAVAGLAFRLVVAKQAGSPDGLSKITSCNRHRWTDGNRPSICLVYGEALHYVFLFALCTGAVSLLCGLLIRNVSLDRDHRLKKPRVAPVVDEAMGPA